MPETSTSLLEQLRSRRANPEAWQRLVDLYTPFLRDWLRCRHSLQDQDVDDLVQETLLVALRRLPGFVHNGKRGAFHKWLRSITALCLLEFWKARNRSPMPAPDQDQLAALRDPASRLSHIWDQEHNQYVARRMWDKVQVEFEPSTLRAFQRVVIDGVKPVDVARELGITRNAVDIATSRVRRRLRQLYDEMQGILD